MKFAKKFSLVLLFCSFCSFSQEDNLSAEENSKDKHWTFTIDLVSRYLWRGQCWGGNYAAIQPSVEYAITPKFSIGTWATTNFKKEYYYPDNENYYRGYQEIDLYLSYQITDFLQLQLWDYYWPSVSKVEGVSNKLFDYSPSSSQTLDAILYFDFLEAYHIPLNATISTLVGGNDYRYDANDSPKRNFTTYLEMGYVFDLFAESKNKYSKHIELSPSVGVVLNNKAAYYNFADYDKASLVNLSLKAKKEFDLGNNIVMPFTINYIHNAATANTNFFGKDFLIAGISFGY
ncbi:TorF family putative porin [Flavobacterium sp. MAHUQ-51]|uniref:TorF family putative porin n=1 Tax=Flavobacterium sp. GCM10022190 TaxID=3252639 RepID=UPI00361B7FB0